MLEVVEVKEQQGAAQVVALEQGDLLAQAVHQQGAVGQVGQRVVVGQVANLCLGVLQLADIAGGQQQAVHLVEGDRLHRHLHGKNIATLVAPEHLAVVHPATLAQLGQQGAALLVVGPDADLIHRVADHFGSAVAGQAAEAVVDFQVATAVAFGDGDGVGAGVEGLGKLFLAGFECRLGALLLGDVAQGGDAAGLVVDGDEAAGNHAGQRCAIAVVDHHGDVAQGLFADHSLDALRAFYRLRPQADFLGGAADHLVGVPAEGLGERRVDLDELASVLAGDADRVGADLEQAGELLFRGTQALFAFHLVGDVEQGTGHAQRVALFVAVQSGAAFDVARDAVLQLHPVGDLVIAGRPFAQAAVGLAHRIALLLRYSFEKRVERFVKGDGRQAVQLRGAGRAVEHAAGDMPVPGAQLCRVQGQVQALLAVLQGLLGALAFGGVDESADQEGHALQFDALGAENAVMHLAADGAKLHFEDQRAAVGPGRFQHHMALFGVDPQAQFQAGLADHLAAGPAEHVFEVLVDLEDHAVVAAGEQNGIGAEVEQGGEAFFRIDQRCFPLALAGDFADHPNHLWPAVRVVGQAAVDLQPVQAAVRPADTVAHGLFHRFAVEHRLEYLACARAVFLGQQVEVVDIGGERALRVEAEQGLGAP